jgi:hypothetical protein
VPAQSEQAPEHVRHVAPEDAAIRVQLVHDDDAELLEELEPLGVMGEDRGVEHVRVGHDDLPRLADRRADGRRRVAVVRGRRHVQPGGPGEGGQLRHLVLPERLRGEQAQRPCRGILGDRLEDRDGEGEALAGRRGGHDDNVLPGVHRLDRVGLMAVRPLDPARGEAGPETGIKPGRPVPVHRLAGRNPLVVDHATRHGGFGEELLEHGQRPGRGVRPHIPLPNGTLDRFGAP